jgi:hypothetical protein
LSTSDNITLSQEYNSWYQRECKINIWTRNKQSSPKVSDIANKNAWLVVNVPAFIGISLEYHKLKFKVCENPFKIVNYCYVENNCTKKRVLEYKLTVKYYLGRC